MYEKIGPRMKITSIPMARSIKDTATETDNGMFKVTEIKVIRLSLVPKAPG